MYGAFDVVLYFVVIQLFWLLINLLLILSYYHTQVRTHGRNSRTHAHTEDFHLVLLFF